MKHNRSRSFKVVNIAILCILPLFTACEEENKDTGCNFIDFATSACLNRVFENVLTGGTTGGSGSSGGSTSGSSNQTPIAVNQFAEYEPNSILNNANPVQFPGTRVGERAGIQINGAIHQVEDVSDFFVFTPPRSGQYKLYVRSGNCSCTATVDGIYLMIYDQSQTTIASTPIATEASLELTVGLSPGLTYYVEIHGDNTQGVHFAYSLMIEELD